jgi:hypothetical protein
VVLIQKYFQNQIREISSDPVLRFYGFFVSCLVVLSSAHWIVYGLHRFLVDRDDSICWPMFQDCSFLRIFSSVQLQFLFYALVLLGLTSACLFLKKKWTAYAWFLLIFINLLKYWIILLDYKMRLNQHIMALWITMVFLLIPNKKRSLQVLIVLFYFWAGVIKFDLEWLSGAALYVKPWFINDTLAPWACTYVVVLETILIWSLLRSKSRLASITFAQLIVFHIFSWKVVGFFYPTTMFCILALFPLLWRKNAPSNQRKISWGLAFVVIAFSLFQILPKTFGGDTSVTGEGRLMALHMFDSLHQCRAKTIFHKVDGRISEESIEVKLAPRIRCDPAVYVSMGRSICKKNIKDPSFQRMDLFLETKRANDTTYHPVLNIMDFCNQSIGYSLFTSNEWILRNHH